MIVQWLKDRLKPEHKGQLASLFYSPFKIRDYLFCCSKGIHYHSSWQFAGLPLVQLRSRNSLAIGIGFRCVSRSRSNTIGVPRRVIIKTLTPTARIMIAKNVGISGSVISSKKSITIGNDVLIGSGCLITDSDAHPLSYEDRLADREPAMAPVVIEDGVFIGARSIILKGVTIGRGSVIGAGSVVSRDVPPGVIVAGNPARVIRPIGSK